MPRFSSLKKSSAAVLLALTARWTWADAMLVYRTRVTSPRGAAPLEDVATRMIKADSSRIEAKGSITVIQASKGFIDQINVPARTYDEISFDSLQAAKDSAERILRTAEKQQPPTRRLTRADLHVRPTDERKTINGFRCRKFLLQLSLEAKDLKTGQISRTRMESQIWTTPETEELRRVQRDEQRFAQAYQYKMGGAASSDVDELETSLAASLTGASERELRTVLARIPTEMAKVQGYPIRTQTDWYAAGGSRPANSVTTELQRISTARLPSELFEVPSGLKKSSARNENNSPTAN